MLYFKKRFILALLVFFSAIRGFSLTTTKDNCPNVRSSVGFVRKRRHIAFPDRSTCSVVTSVVKTFMTHVPSGWFMVIEAELVYKLPDAKVIASHKRRKLHHRQKREFWDMLRGALDVRNMNGQACVIRSICEAKTLLAPPGRSLVHDILRVVFTAPLHEEEFTEEIRLSHGELLEPNVCDRANECPFSLINFILDLNKMPK